MPKQHVFKGRVLHDKKEYVKGQLCPDHLLELMGKIGVVEELPEPVKPVEAPEPVQRPRNNKPE